MPYQVRLSQLTDRDAFEKEIHNHIARLKAFNYQVGKPRPTTHAVVEACLKRVQEPGKPDTYVPDYEIIDDTPTGAPLDERKEMFHQQIMRLEIEAKHKLMPPRKIRLLNFRYVAASSLKEDERSEADHKLIADVEALRARHREIELKGAEAEAALEELTEENVNSWQPPNFE